MNKDTLDCSASRDAQETELAVALSLCKGAKRVQLTQAVRESGNYRAISGYISATELASAQLCIDECLRHRIEVLRLTHARYPALLREISDPPPVIFVLRCQKEAEITQRSVAIVGTRSASIEVCESARQLGQDLVDAGITVVSGLALGIDGAAHRGALCSTLECPTVAVLAHGLDCVYPPSHRWLAEQILQHGGVLVSEYPPGVEPRRHHFLARNRIVAGLVRGVVVVQAGARSGSLVTASFAADYGRDVFVMTGQEFDGRGEGGNNLIEQGAIPIRGAGDILHEYGELQMSEEAYAEGDWRIMSLDALLRQYPLSRIELLQWEVEGRLSWISGNQVRVRL